MLEMKELVTFSLMLSALSATAAAAGTADQKLVAAYDPEDAASVSLLEEARSVLRQHRLDLGTAAELNLSSDDLRELGVTNVLSRVAALRAMQHTRTTQWVVPAALPLPRVQEFAFAISHYNTSRQWGKCLNMIIKCVCSSPP